MHSKQYGGPTPPVNPPRPEERTFQDLLKLEAPKSEQENLRFLEWLAANAPTAEVALRNYRMLVSLELSVLEKFLSHKERFAPQEEVDPVASELGVAPKPTPTNREMLALWNGQLASCTIGYVAVRVGSSHTRERTEYLVRVESAPGQDAGLAYIESSCLASEIPIVSKVVQENLWHAQVCRFSILHNELRTALMRVRWLKEEFGHADPKARQAQAHEADMMGAESGGG